MKQVLFLVVFVLLGIGLTFYLIQPREKKLPVINPIDVNENLVDSSMLRIGYGHQIGDFTFLNQNGRKIHSKDLANKVFVAEYFFTTCKTICPVMTMQMKRVHDAYINEDDVIILSFTVDPETDTVEQLKRYANKQGALSGKWHFLTGSKDSLYNLARKSFFVLKPAEAENVGDAGSDFIHTNNFVLVDRQRRIRGYYDGTSQKDTDRLIRDIGRLLEEK